MVGVDAAGTAANEGLERASVWMHLEAAGYLTGGFDNPAATVIDDEYACSSTICPDNGFGVGMNLSYGALSQSDAAAATPVLAHELITGRGIPIEVLAELDRKVDDGEAGSGAMQLGAAGTGFTAGDVGLCQNAGDADLYGILTPSANCAAVFRNF